jgi:hypothetical protein
MTLVLARAGEPMRACEIYPAANELVDAPLEWRSATIEGDRRFRHLGHGFYELAG